MSVMMKKRVFDYVMIVLLATVLAASYVLFIVPNKFAPAGFNGIGTMIQYKMGFSIAYFSLIVNVPLCLFAFLRIDKLFGIRSMVFCFAYSAAYLLLRQSAIVRFRYDAGGTDTIFPCLLAGMISGVVYGLCFRRTASTGGTDIIAKYVNQKNPLLNFFWVNFALNAAVALVSYFVYAEEIDGVMYYDYRPVCLCVFYSFISSFVGSKIISGAKEAYRFTVFTTHADEISAEILEKLQHSGTRIKGVGLYSGEERQVIVSVVNKHQIVDFENIIKKYDNTFAEVEHVHETIGFFRKIK